MVRMIAACGAATAAAPAFPAARAPATQRPGQQHGDDQLGLRAGDLFAQLCQMSPGEMAGFVGEHADDLVRCIGLAQRAVVDENPAPVGDERVEGRSLMMTTWMFCFSSPAAQDRARIVAQSCSVSASRSSGGRPAGREPARTRQEALRR
jgi:hypothetical protein